MWKINHDRIQIVADRQGQTDIILGHHGSRDVLGVGVNVGVIIMPQRKVRKVTEADKKEMKRLRKKIVVNTSNGVMGPMSYAQIGVIFNLSPGTILYHLNPEVKRKIKNRAKEYKKRHPERIKNDPEYMAKYMKRKYNEDPEFKARAKRNSVAWTRKNKKKLNMYYREKQFTCKSCDRDFLDRDSAVSRTGSVGICHRCGLVVKKVFHHHR